MVDSRIRPTAQWVKVNSMVCRRNIVNLNIGSKPSWWVWPISCDSFKRETQCGTPNASPKLHNPLGYTFFKSLISIVSPMKNSPALSISLQSCFWWKTLWVFVILLRDIGRWASLAVASIIICLSCLLTSTIIPSWDDSCNTYSGAINS